jgi:quercetin dioxygenase-like cupin family protein
VSRFLIPPDGGKTFVAGPLGVISKLTPAETGGSFSIVEHPIAPGVLVPPHTYLDEDEFSYVLEGVVGVRIGNETAEATPGYYVMKPRGIRHTFWNPGPAPARLLEIISPSGFERYFEEMGELTRDRAPTPEEIEKLAAKYGLVYDLDWVPELTAKYNLQLLRRRSDTAG